MPYYPDYSFRETSPSPGVGSREAGTRRVIPRDR
jgi:hypothetical protein